MGILAPRLIVQPFSQNRTQVKLVRLSTHYGNAAFYPKFTHIQFGSNVHHKPWSFLHPIRGLSDSLLLANVPIQFNDMKKDDLDCPTHRDSLKKFATSRLRVWTQMWQKVTIQVQNIRWTEKRGSRCDHGHILCRNNEVRTKKQQPQVLPVSWARP